MLVITPVVCVTAAMAFSRLLEAYIDPAIPQEQTTEVKESKKKSSPVARSGVHGIDTRFSVISTLVLFLFLFVLHCTWVTSTAYSSPSVVLASRNPDGSQNIIDDFREAYYWLRSNTEKDAVVMSWWDYGYQIAGMADRPVGA
jgi:dolichyl-diphosphooligosaccharide--protein glycosyltransferase